MDAQVEVRASTVRGYEDPLTGSLNAGIAVWLISAGRAPSAYVASQGTVLGRRGRVQVGRDDRGAWIGGDVISSIRGAVSFGL